MEKEKRVTAYVSDIKTLVILGELDTKRYSDSWLALCNNKRENKEFIELTNFYDSNKIRVVVDITATHNEDLEEVIQHYKEFFASWGLDTTNTTIEDAKHYVIEEYQLDEDKPVYLELS